MANTTEEPFLKHEDYTIGWVCALPKEMTAARSMLDENHPDLLLPSSDHNSYSLGRIGAHNVVIACLPKGEIGTTSAATVATRMSCTFTSIRFGLMIGVGGGVPSKSHDIRLGDVVVSTPIGQHGGVVQWDFGKTTKGGHFERTGTLNRPPAVLMAALSKLESTHEMEDSKVSKYLSDMVTRYPKLSSKFTRQVFLDDVLFEAEYDHVEDNDTCSNCDTNRIVNRPPRNVVAIHYGLIASGNQVMKYGVKRDEISNDLGGVLCFEMEAAGLMNEFPCIIIRGICDYADSHKNKQWQEYAAATAAAFAKELLNSIPANQALGTRTVNEVISEVKSLKDSLHSWRQTDEERICHQNFRNSEYEEYKNINDVRLDGTCQWFLEHPNYDSWRSNNASGLLWVSANPGCGKSVLSRFLVDDELKSTHSRTTCYFFFKDNDNQNSALRALCALLHQLFSKRPRLLKHAIPDFRSNGTELPKLFSKLWDILKNAGADPEASEITCILDALDECKETERLQLIDTLKQFYSSDAGAEGKKTAVKFIITSRPYFNIERGFKELTEGIPTIRLAGEEEIESISQEIDMVIKVKVRKIGSDLGLEDSVQKSLEVDLLQITHRTYLWLKLIVDVIYKRLEVTTKTELQQAIRTVPATVDDAYEEILKRSPDISRAKKLLHIVVSAVRPLTLKEMNVALAIKEGNRSIEDLDLTQEEKFKTIVTNLCGLFVTVFDSKVYLIHQTAKEFLVKDNTTQISSMGLWKHSLELRESNLVLAKICILYLLFTVFEQDPLVINDGVPEHEVQSHIDRYTNKHDLLDYSAKHWATHFRNAKIMDGVIVELASELCNGRSERFQTWSQVYFVTSNFSSRFAQSLSDLMISSYFGLDAVVRLLVEKGACIKAKDIDGWTALHWAAQQRRQAVVRLLLEKAADTEAKDNSGQTTLHWATRYRHEDVVHLLVKNGANVEARDIDGRTALHWAACSGQAVARLLLENEADIEAKDNRGWTALHWAAAGGHESGVRLLLEKGADVEAKNNKGQTALHWTVWYGHEAVVQLLLEKGADVEAKDNCGWTALHHAVSDRNKAMMQLLLEKEADTEAKDNDGRTVLHWTARYGHEEVVQLLLEKGADTESKDNGGRTALYWAAWNGYEAVVLLLLEKGADIEAKDIGGQTALHGAAWHGHEELLQLLLEKGADTESKDNNGRTALYWAAWNGHQTIVQQLEKGAVKI